MRFITTALCLFLMNNLLGKFPDNFDRPLEIVAFGSCNRDELPQPVWPAIEALQPDLWIWAGDNIYADWYQPPSDEKVKYTVNREWMTKRYAAQFNRPDYTAIRATTSILGTWDDHDYGKNNAGAEFKLKDVARDLALTFMEVPLSDPRWQREGLYGSYDFGPEGKRTRVILIDNRYFATPHDRTNSTMLGADQRNWLEAQLKESTADLHLIVSGSQFASNKHKWDSWQKYPQEREWMLDLIAETGQSVIFLSGDRHIHEISAIETASIPYPLVDITSSGLTHSWESFSGERNPHRIGDVFTGLGFGLLKIDWSEASPQVVLEIRTPENETALSYHVDFNK